VAVPWRTDLAHTVEHPGHADGADAKAQGSAGSLRAVSRVAIARQQARPLT
jgi:hypothetical protein